MSAEPFAGLLRRGVKPGLERIRKLLARLDHPERAFRVAIVGGSNGKGSTARALAAILTAAGEKTGLFTSPHLLRVNERIAVDGREIEDAELEAAWDELAPHVRATEATYFEALAALALFYFAHRGVGTAVLEVGLGGRFDAVNATEPELSLITNLSLEHTDWLGPTLAHIAREKAGIMRGGRPVITAATGYARELLRAQARRRGATFEQVVPRLVEPSGYGVAFSFSGRRYYGALMGRHQAANLALAVRAAQLLGLPDSAVGRGLAQLANPGRLSYYASERLLCDGAHNPAGAAALVKALADYFPTSPKTLVFAASRGKDVATMAAWLRPHFYRVFLTAYPGARAADPRELLAYFPGAQVVPSPGAALAQAQRGRRPGELTVASGSLYLLAALARARAGLPPEERFQ